MTKKENETIKYRIIRDINHLFEKEEDYSKPGRVGNIYHNNYIEDESNGDINKIKPYQSKNTPMKLNHTWKTINHLRNFDTLWIQLTIAINFMSSKGSDE